MSIVAEREQALVQQAQAGDIAAWEALVQQHQAAVFRLAYLILHDAHEAEDAAQDALIRAYRQLAKVDATQGLRPWLLRLTRNVALNRQRSLGRYWQMTRRFFQAAPTHEAGRHAQRLAQQTEAELLWQAVQQLKPNGRSHPSPYPLQHRHQLVFTAVLPQQPAHIADPLRLPLVVKVNLFGAAQPSNGRRDYRR